MATNNALNNSMDELTIAATTKVNKILDEDNMASDDAEALATQQSIKAYVDSQAHSVPGGVNTNIQYNNSGAFGGDANFTTNGTGSVNITGDLDVDNLNLNGNTIISTNANGDINVNPNGSGKLIIQSTVGVDGVINDATMATASATKLSTSLGTKTYVDDSIAPLAVMNRDNVINGGDLSVNAWQRGTSFTSPATNTFTADGFQWVSTGTGVVNILKTADAPTAAEAGILSNDCLHVDVTTADTSIAVGDRYLIRTGVEGYDWAPLAQKACVLTFWVKAAKTGTHCVALQNSGVDRSFIAEYTISSANTWEKKTISIPASPAAGTWDYTNGLGISVVFPLAAGSTYQGTAGIWNTGNLFCTAASVNEMDNTANDFKIDLIQLQAGTTATPFIAKSRKEVLGKAQRYFQKTFPIGTAPVSASGVNSGAMAYRVIDNGEPGAAQWVFPQPMRSTPTITFYNPQAAGSNWRNIDDNSNSGTSAATLVSERSIFATNTGVGGDTKSETVIIHATASATLF